MRVGVTLPMYELESGRTLRLEEIAAHAEEAERLGFDAVHARLHDASVLTTAPAPAVWVAAFGPRMLRLTARYADGWNTAWHGPDTGRFGEELGRLRGALDDAGRDPAAVEVSAAL